MNQESSLAFNIQSSYDLKVDPEPSIKMINYSKSARMLAPSTIKIQSSTEVGGETLQKCIRKGDKIYRANSEHIHMFDEKAVKKNGTKSNLAITHEVDEVKSGESLYKSFSFEQSLNYDDTEKCIAFWRSVMEKNLAPIKCSIIEQNENEVPLEKEEVISVTESTQSDVVKLHEDYKNMVRSVLKDLQRKRLHEIKMYGARCKLCESLSSSVNDKSDGHSKIDMESEIGELDNWSPESSTKGKYDKKESLHVTSEVSDEKKSQLHDKNKYKHIDVIDEKKKSGVYTEWRRNKVKDTCPCEQQNCDCNINPAIVSAEFEKMPTDLDASVEQRGEGTTSSGTGTETDSSSDQDNSGASSTYVEKTIQSTNQTVSLIVDCPCISEVCTCMSNKITIEKSKITETTSREVIKPPVLSTVTVVSSIEMCRTTVEPTPRLTNSLEQNNIEAATSSKEGMRSEKNCEMCAN